MSAPRPDPSESDSPQSSLQDPFGEGAAAAKTRRMRSLMIALALVAFVIIVFAATMLKLAANAAHVVPQT